MPSLYSMKEHYKNTPKVIGHQLKDMANSGINEVFKNTTTYRKGMIYDCNLNPIEEMEFRFIKTKTYTMEKDAVEYMIMFRPMINPEIDFDKSKDKKHRLGYYIDVYDDNTKQINKWLITGKDESEFDKYNVLKCNWNFEWIDKNRVYHKVLGCVRDRNNYNSGVWASDFSTTVENQTAFIVPSNNDTDTIDYGIRFMITDNLLYPKTYETTKLMDTFPLGILKVTLGQSHHNEHTDLCQEVQLEELGDEEPIMHMICDYYKSSLPPIVEEYTENEIWKLENINDKLRVNEEIQIKAIPNILGSVCEWHVQVDNVDYEFNDLSDYIDFTFINSVTSNDILSMRVINDVMIGYVIKILIYDSNHTYYDFVEMEVIDG